MQHASFKQQIKCAQRIIIKIQNFLTGSSISNITFCFVGRLEFLNSHLSSNHASILPTNTILVVNKIARSIFICNFRMIPTWLINCLFWKWFNVHLLKLLGTSFPGMDRDEHSSHLCIGGHTSVWP